jgi:hypothetical protein
MKKIAIALATVAAIAAISAPAEARGGRNAAAIGFGLAAGALAAGAAASSYNSYNYYGGPSYGYAEPSYGYVERPYYRRSYYNDHSNDPSPVDMNPYHPAW